MKTFKSYFCFTRNSQQSEKKKVRILFFFLFTFFIRFHSSFFNFHTHVNDLNENEQGLLYLSIENLVIVCDIPCPKSSPTLVNIYVNVTGVGHLQTFCCWPSCPTTNDSPTLIVCSFHTVNRYVLALWANARMFHQVIKSKEEQDLNRKKYTNRIQK